MGEIERETVLELVSRRQAQKRDREKKEEEAGNCDDEVRC